MSDILAAIRRWQDPGTWQTVRELAALAAGFDEQRSELASGVRLLLDRGEPEQARQLKADADHLGKSAADVRRQRAELAEEFSQIERWVRSRRPELLEFVPTAEFSGEPSAAIRELKRLESRLLSGDETEWTIYRTPGEWRTLRERAGLSASESTWRNLRKEHSGDMQGESGNEDKMVRLTRHLAQSWGLNLPEFKPATST